VFLLIRHSKYCAILSKMHSYRLLLVCPLLVVLLFIVIYFSDSRIGKKTNMMYIIAIVVGTCVVLIIGVVSILVVALRYRRKRYVYRRLPRQSFMVV